MRPVVLYIDDNADDLYLAASAAKRSCLPFTLCAAVGIPGAMKCLAVLTELPAMVIMDYALESSCAPDLIRWLHDDPAWGRIPIVIVSSRDDPACVAHCYTTGADSFLAKAQTFDELSDMLTAVAACVTEKPVSLEHLKKLPSFRTYPAVKLRDSLEEQGRLNIQLRHRLSVLRAQLDIARAEAKEEKRKYPYPRKRDPLRPDNE
jgi:CheY-like chemotaxis protein